MLEELKETFMDNSQELSFVEPIQIAHSVYVDLTNASKSFVANGSILEATAKFN